MWGMTQDPVRGQWFIGVVKGLDVIKTGAPHRAGGCGEGGSRLGGHQKRIGSQIARIWKRLAQTPARQEGRRPTGHLELFCKRKRIEHGVELPLPGEGRRHQQINSETTLPRPLSGARKGGGLTKKKRRQIKRKNEKRKKRQLGGRCSEEAGHTLMKVCQVR